MFPWPTSCLPALIHLPVSLFYCSFAKSSFTFPACFLSIYSFLKPSTETTFPDHQSLLICNPVVILQPWSFLISAAYCRCPSFWLKPVFSLRSITFPLVVSAWKHVFLPVPKMLLPIPSIQYLCPQVSFFSPWSYIFPRFEQLIMPTFISQSRSQLWASHSDISYYFRNNNTKILPK